MIPGWREEVVGDYVEVLKSQGKVTPAMVAARLGISECCAVYWLTDLARDGRVRILAVELVEHGGTPCAMPRPPLRASARPFARHSVVLQPYHKRDELVAISSSPPDRPLPPGPDFPGLLPVPSRTKSALLLRMRRAESWTCSAANSSPASADPRQVNRQDAKAAKKFPIFKGTAGERTWRSPESFGLGAGAHRRSQPQSL